MSLTHAARPHIGLLRRGRRDVPSFAGLAWVKANGTEGDFREELALFEADQGRLVDSYWCTSTVGGVALT